MERRRAGGKTHLIMVQQSIHGLVHIHRVSDEMHDSIPDRNDDSFGFRQQKQDQLRQPKTKTENQAENEEKPVG